jgi:hypothetical protein
MIHHVTFEVSKGCITKELEFWSLLGFNPTGLRRRTRKQPPIHWLICGDETFAVELIPVDVGPLPDDSQGVGHLCLELGARRWEIASLGMRRFTHRFDPHPDWKHHAFTTSPSGHVVEICAFANSIKSGPPLEGN